MSRLGVLVLPRPDFCTRYCVLGYEATRGKFIHMPTPPTTKRAKAVTAIHVVGRNVQSCGVSKSTRTRRMHYARRSVSSGLLGIAANMKAGPVSTNNPVFIRWPTSTAKHFVGESYRNIF